MVAHIFLIRFRNFTSRDDIYLGNSLISERDALAARKFSLRATGCKVAVSAVQRVVGDRLHLDRLVRLPVSHADLNCAASDKTVLVLDYVVLDLILPLTYLIIDGFFFRLVLAVDFLSSVGDVALVAEQVVILAGDGLFALDAVARENLVLGFQSFFECKAQVVLRVCVRNVCVDEELF